ncbi:MAG: hypothetical protein RR869_01205 [Lachnospiraceae bacterium]
MKKTMAKRSSLFLLELIVAILFFALSSAVCVQLFTKSHLQAVSSANLNMALSKAQSVAEGFRSTDGSMNALQSLFPQSETAEDTLSINYDSSGDYCKSDLATLQLKVVLSSHRQEQTASISVVSLNPTREIYQILVTRHIPNRRASYEP